MIRFIFSVNDQRKKKNSIQVKVKTREYFERGRASQFVIQFLFRMNEKWHALVTFKPK